MKILVNVFIIFHLLAISLWSLPQSLFRSKLCQPFVPYMMWSALWQSWDMFSPNPMSANIHMDAVFVFKDGSMKTWDAPRMERLGYWQRYRQERYRKWRDRVRQDDYRLVWNDTARFLAYRYRQTNNPPEWISMRRHWSDIPPPRSGRSKMPIPREYPLTNTYIFKVYNVQPEDLR